MNYTSVPNYTSNPTTPRALEASPHKLRPLLLLKFSVRSCSQFQAKGKSQEMLPDSTWNRSWKGSKNKTLSVMQMLSGTKSQLVSKQEKKKITITQKCYFSWIIKNGQKNIYLYSTRNSCAKRQSPPWLVCTHALHTHVTGGRNNQPTKQKIKQKNTQVEFCPSGLRAVRLREEDSSRSPSPRAACSPDRSAPRAGGTTRKAPLRARWARLPTRRPRQHGSGSRPSHPPQPLQQTERARRKARGTPQRSGPRAPAPASRGRGKGTAGPLEAR